VIVRTLPSAGVSVVATLTVLHVVLGVLPVVFVVATSVLIGRVPAAVAHGLHSPQWHALVMSFVVASVAFVAQQLLSPTVSALAEVVRHRINGVFRDRLIAVSLASVGIGALEDQDSLNDLRQAADTLENGFRAPGDAAAGTLAYVTRYTALLGFVIAVGVAGAWIPALAIALSAGLFRYGHRSGLRLYTRIWPTRAPYQRKREYLRRIGTESAAAKEMRVFALTDWVRERHRETAIEGLKPLWSERRRMAVYRMLWFTAVGLVVATLGLAVLARSAADGKLSLAHLALALQASIAALLLGEYYVEADNQAAFGMLATAALERFERRVAALADSDVAATGTSSARRLPQRDITFNDVSFVYRGAARPVLEGLDLTLRAGECTALVGLNGAGKTTLVKLLARLYEPTAGEITVDGVPLPELDVASWRGQLGVIFQDFTKYELSAADNIAFGAVEHPLDLDAIKRAASTAGIGDTLERLPHGLDTLLAPHYEDGTDLSGGQWQRVAIARALYAVDAGARVLVMDEPTAALDVRAEAAFFEQFADVTRGLTTLLISHRFSSVRHADRIVVLGRGRVVEEGSHDELLAAGGRYAHLFALQAERFAAGLDVDGDAVDGVDELMSVEESR
jgi:ATP-binding cassette subfamily B protein